MVVLGSYGTTITSLYHIRLIDCLAPWAFHFPWPCQRDRELSIASPAPRSLVSFLLHVSDFAVRYLILISACLPEKAQRISKRSLWIRFRYDNPLEPYVVRLSSFTIPEYFGHQQNASQQCWSVHLRLGLSDLFHRCNRIVCPQVFQHSLNVQSGQD